MRKLLDYAHCEDPTIRLATINADTIKMEVVQHDASLMFISELSTVIGLLGYKWTRPQSEMEAAIIQTLVTMRETLRKEYEARQLENEGAR